MLDSAPFAIGNADPAPMLYAPPVVFSSPFSHREHYSSSLPATPIARSKKHNVDLQFDRSFCDPLRLPLVCAALIPRVREIFDHSSLNGSGNSSCGPVRVPFGTTMLLPSDSDTLPTPSAKRELIRKA